MVLAGTIFFIGACFGWIWRKMEEKKKK